MSVRVLTALCLAGSLAAGTPQAVAQEQPDEVLARARQTLNEEGPKSALPLFERALSLYQAASDRRGEAIATGLVGNCHRRLGDYPKALDLLNRALAMKRELGDQLEEGKTLSHLGLVYWETGRYPEAIDHLTRAIAIGRELGDAQLEGSALNNLSLVYDEQGDYRRSLEQYQKVLELYRGANFERGESDTLGNIGGVHLLLGQYREALRYYEQALAISERLKLKGSASQDLGNMALCHLGLGQVPDAIDDFDRALALAREAGLKKEEADWLKGRASALVRLGRYTEAKDGYDRALRVYDEARLQRELVEALGDLGVLHQRLGDAASAERSFRRAIDLSRAIDHPRGVTLNVMALGDLERRRKRPDEAAALYRDALTRATQAGDRATAASARIALASVDRDLGQLDEAAVEASQAVTDARALGARPLEGEAVLARGEVAGAQSRPDDALRDYAGAAAIAKELADPELAWRAAYRQGQALEALGRNHEAVTSYEQAVGVIEDVRSQLGEERFRASYLEDKYQVYASLVQLLLKLGRAQEAFTYAERLRARYYLEWLNRAVPPIQDDARRQKELALRERVRQLERAIAQERAKPAGEQRRQALELFSAELLDAERAYQDSLDTLAATEPAYAAARALTTVAVDATQQLLPPDAALVEYVVGDEGVSIFVVRTNGLQARTVPLRSIDLSAKVELLRDLVVREQRGDWRAPAASLHQALVASIEDAGWLAGVRRLYLVPHGILHYVPFAALPRGRDENSRLVVQDYVVAYLPAAAALGSDAGSARASESVLAMAPARAGLRFSQQEATAVASFFPKEHTVLVGGRATEGAFKTSAGAYDVLHLATHGYFNRFNPLLSGLELEPDARDDGQLEVHEILGLRLRADLVVLSACDTALGGGYFAEVPAGDDIVGLTRAFLFAGSPSVVASLWAVNDRSTMRLMSRFYGQLGGADKATALAMAQRELITRGGRDSHPYFWGAFVLVGQMR